MVLRWNTAGESHGPALIALLEGFPAGVHITSETIAKELARRRLGYGRGARMSFEKDAIRILSGVRHGLTLGDPITVEIANTEWPKWEQVMSADPVDHATYEGQARAAKLTRPRPGHADLSGMLKYGFDDARPVLERASARETAARVAAGAFAKALLAELGEISVFSHIISIGASDPYAGPSPCPADLPLIDESPVRAFSKTAEAAMIEEIEAAKRDGDTLGGVIEVIADNVPVGIGSFTTGPGRLDAQLAAGLLSIQAMKGVEIGDGFATARRRGSAAHDEIIAGDKASYRETNRAGGIEGGMSNGEAIRARVAMKPISTVPKALRTIDIDTGEAATAIHQRSDICAVPAAGVVCEAVTALVIAAAVVEKFGGDSLSELQRNYQGYLTEITGRYGYITAQNNPAKQALAVHPVPTEEAG